MLTQCSHDRTFALANLSAYKLIPQRSTCLTSFRYLQYHLLPEKGALLWPSALKTFKFSILYMIPCSNQMTFWGLFLHEFSSVQLLSCVTLCDPMDCRMPRFPVHHQIPKLTQTLVHQVGDAIQLSHPLSSLSPPAPNPSQHQGLFQWVNSSPHTKNV